MANSISNETNNSDILISSFVPHLLRAAYNEDPNRQVNSINTRDYASLLWVDICNFSKISKEFLDEEDGLEQLSVLLWNHYDPLLRIVNQGGGSPILYAGDGVLFAWHSDHASLKENMIQALAVGQQVISKNALRNFTGEKIQLHVVAAGGKFNLLEIKDHNDRVLISPLGNALNDLKEATGSRAPDQVLVSEKVQQELTDQVRLKRLESGGVVLDTELSAKQEALPLFEFSSDTIEKALTPYVPQSIRYQLDKERIKWIGELRSTTLLYVQISGFDPDSKDAAEVLSNAVHMSSQVVNSNEGILGQVWIDEKDANFLIYFGPPPTAHRDNPYRGVKCSLELDKILTDNGFHVSIGVVSGSNYCGLLGNDIFRQYTVIGDNVTLSARMAVQREKGIWCDDQTKNLARNGILYGESQEIVVKGTSEPIIVWEPLALEDAVDTHYKKHLIGREKELKQILGELKKVQESGKSALLVEGESGMGKSYLIDYIEMECKRHQTTVLRGKPERIGNKSTYQGIRQIIETIISVGAITDTSMKSDSVVNNLAPEFRDRASFLNVVLKTNIPDSKDTALLSGLQKAVATKQLLLELIASYSKKGPLVIIVDDAQWIDEASWDLITELAHELDNCMILCSVQNSKSDPACENFIASGATVIELKSLNDEEQDHLIASILEVQNVTPMVSEPIKNIAKGNPFFCIELALTLKAEGSIICDDVMCDLKPGANTEKLKLPMTIKGAVRRKIDLLEPGPEMALKVASVAGQRFSGELIQDVYPIQNERPHVPEYIAKDNQMGLIQLDTDNQIEEYVFNHSLIREVAYETMLKEQTIPLHIKTAEWFEANFADHMTPYLLRVAYHWEMAGENLKAVDYMDKEAIRLFSQGFAADSVRIGLDALKLLNVKISRDPVNIGPEIGGNMGKIGAIMAGKHPAELLNHKKLKNEETERVLALILEIGPFAFQSKQIDLFALLSVTCLRITLEEGNGRNAADVYSMYSVIHRAMTQNRMEGNAWSQLALDLDAKNGGRLHARVAFVHTWFHNHWKESIQTSLKLSSEAASKGFETGDFLFGCFNLSGHVVYQAYCGIPLIKVMDTARNHLEINGRKVMNAAFHLIHEIQQAKAFAGLTENPLSMSDAEFNEEQDIASICTTEFGNQIGYYLVSRLKLHYHFGDIDGALQWASNVAPLLPAFEGQVAEVDHLQFKTLALIDVSTRGRKEYADHAEEIDQNIQIMRDWKGLCPENFEHKLYLLEGYRIGVNGSASEGLSLLEKASTLASKHGYLNDLGLIHECGAIIERKENISQTHLQRAIDANLKWGAHAKVDYLKKRFEVQ